jgi:hypothetical protein
MSNHTGNEGQVKVGGVVVAETRSWSIDMSVATVDTTVIGDTDESHKTLQKSWTGSADVFWDESDSAAQGCDVGDSVTLALYPAGDGSGNTFYSGTATVEKLSIKGTYNGMVEASISFKGNGALTKDTV